MQLTFELRGETALLTLIHARLLAQFGRPGPWRLLDPVSQLAMGIIGCKTDSTISRVVHTRVLAVFGDWENVRDASHSDLLDELHGLNFVDAKAIRLQSSLKAITRIRGQLDLDFLSVRAVGEGLTWLERLYGVGRKVAAATLNFSTLRKRCLVIDTHGLRVLRRLGLIGSRDSYAAAYDRIMPLVPGDWSASDFDDHHQLVKKLGQAYCRPQVPLCGICPIRDSCATGAPRAARHPLAEAPHGGR